MTMADEEFLRQVGATSKEAAAAQWDAVHGECYKRWLDERDARERAEQKVAELVQSHADALAEEWHRGGERWRTVAICLGAALLAVLAAVLR